MSEEKRVKLTDILARLGEIARDVGTSRHHALASATVAPSPTPSTLGVAVPFVVVQSSPTPLPYKAVVIELDENSTEGPTSKRLRCTPVMSSHSSSTGRSVSPLDHTTSISLLPDLGGTIASPTPPALELPLVLQHVLKGFQLGVTMDLDEAAARERLASILGLFLLSLTLF